MVNIDEVVEKILAKTKEQMIRSFYSLGDIREKGSDWHVLIRHINGDDCENWDFFKFYINGILNLEVEKLTDLQKRMLTAEAYDNLYNYSQAEYLLKATEEERDDELPYYEEQSVENYLFGLLWKFADGNSFMMKDNFQ